MGPSIFTASATKDDLIYRSASELARLIRAKSISSEEIVRACLARIAEVNPKLNAVCQVDEKGALAAARKADAALKRGDTLGRLHGVPITIKDSFDTKGIISAAGTEGRKAFVPEKDATVVARLRDAGAIILGKTNTPELTLSYDTDNLVYGPTHNPFDLARTPGGSSGGSAAIVAVGGIPLDIGSDTAGSIRIPAHFCGVAGLKPSIDRVSRAGHILPPRDRGLINRRTHVGPLARFVEDLVLALSIISGPDPEDPDVKSFPVEDPAMVDLTKLRVAHFTETGRAKASAEMVLAVRSAAEALTRSGLKCVAARLPGIEMAPQFQAGLNQFALEEFEEVLRKAGTTRPHPQTAGLLKEMQGKSTPDGFFVELKKIQQAALKFMEDFEILICPPCSNSAPTPKNLGLIDFSYASFFNLPGIGWPAAVVRVGRAASGMPRGVQIVGRPWKEHEVLAVASLLEKELGGWKKDFQDGKLKT